jgi:hypothetical protein
MAARLIGLSGRIALVTGQAQYEDGGMLANLQP